MNATTEQPRVGNVSYRISKSIRSTRGHDGAVVLDIEQGRIFNLNLVGSTILELLERGSVEADIIRAISNAFQADEETVARDVGEFIAVLRQHKLLIGCQS